MVAKRLFISYAWESDEYRLWVRRLAARFRQDGVDARLDYWHLKPNDNIPEFMSREVRLADWVLVLCSPAYQSKVHATEEGQRVSGVGWEARLLTGRMLGGSENKTLAALGQGSWPESSPDFLAGQLYYDLSEERTFGRTYHELLQRISGTYQSAPPLGGLPAGLETEPVEPLSDVPDDGASIHGSQDDEVLKSPNKQATKRETFASAFGKRPILLLHLSDLHFGSHSRFLGENPERLGESFHRALAAAQKRLGLDELTVDLVLVTGDIAETGKRSEFEEARRFLAALGGGLGLIAGRFVFVPGNHDINWASCKRAEAELEEREELDPDHLRRRLDEVKLDFYLDFLRRFYDITDLAVVGQPLERGANLRSFPDIRLAVAALNSCEQESHRPADHVGLVSREQAESVLSALRRGEVASWLKIIAIHHNPDVITPPNFNNWRRHLEKAGTFDAGLLDRYEGDAFGLKGRDRVQAVATDAGVQLVLHGHYHAQGKQTWDWRGSGYTHVLSAGSLGLRPEVLPKDEPASARLIVLDPEREQIRAHWFAYTAWHRLEGSVEWGAFAPDPAGWMVKSLDLPEGFLADTGPAPRTANSAVDAEFLLAFRQRLRDPYSRWDVGSLGAIRLGSAQAAESAPLEDMYLELRFGSKLDPADTKDSRPMRPQDLLERDQPLVLRGIGGAGKTTWARFTFSQLVRNEGALPLMLVLRDVARHWQLPVCVGEDRSIDAALDGWIGSQMGAGWRGRLASLLKTDSGPRPVLFVDGWDEVGPLGGELRGKLLGFLREHRRVLAVVTSRPFGQDPPSHSDGFEVLDLQSLSDEDVEDLTGRFFRRFASGGDAAAELESGRFLAALARSPEARDLARTPLLLTMMLLVGQSQPLPDKRHLLYEKCIDALLNARPEQKAAEGALPGRHVWCPPDIDQRRRWVAALAHSVQAVGYRDTSRAPIVRRWDEMKSLLPDECPRDRRDGFLAWLVESAGLLADRADGTLAFAHLSFQEYLTAYHLETTAADAAGRRAAFDQGIADPDWWETLRLLAAQIAARNPAFLARVLEDLLQVPASDRAVVFAGTVFADGLGPAPLFDTWKDLWIEGLARNWPPGAELCSAAWRVTLQEDRQSVLARTLWEQAPGLTWLGWQRFEIFGGKWAELPARPAGKLACSLLGALRADEHTPDEFAAGRVICGLVPLWPSAREAAGLLQIWPSRRRLVGLQLQSALSAGAPQGLLAPALRTAPLSADEAAGAILGNSREWDPILTTGLAREWVIDWDRDDPNVDSTLNAARDLARNWARDWACYSARDWARELAREMARDWIRDWIGQWALHWSIDWSRDLARDWARHWARDWARELARNRAHYRAYNRTRSWVDAWARDWAGKLELDSTPAWLDDFARIEMFSPGRIAGRAFLAASTDSARMGLPFQLLSDACRLSFHPNDRTALHVPACGRIDPLWPALARHVARRSTTQDRELLIELACHPEKREPPLQWGLRFIVRGDLLLADGSFLTLDELADEGGVEHLPYLDEMVPELEVDWLEG